MSGIFGIISRKTIKKDECSGLEIWNQGYGDLNCQRKLADNYLFGVKPEILRGQESDSDIYVFEEQDKIGVVDALIFGDKREDVSDEQYIFSQTCKEGIDVVKDINGDFAGAIFDKESYKLTLFRDHMGVRPLFYYQDSEKIIFSTDIRGITSIANVDTSVDERWLYRKSIGASYMSPIDTEFEKIKCVPFGGYVEFHMENNGWTKKEGHYWIPGAKKIRLKSREEYTKELRRLVEDAVSIRANVSKLPVGSELSGGLDSGVIDLILARIRKDCVYYSWTPGEEYLPLAEKDERLIIKEICDLTGIKCNYGGLKIKVNGDPLIESRCPISQKGKYKNASSYVKYAFPAYVNTMQIYETSAFMKEKGVKFVFTGHGGDEGISHRANPYELVHYHEYYRYLRLMYSRSSIYKHRLIKTVGIIKDNLKYAKNVLKKPFSYERTADNQIVSEILADKYKGESLPLLYFAYDPQRYIVDGGSRNRLDNLAFYNSCTGVRYLVPYVDYRVVDFALGIPRYLYHNWYYTRYIFREAFKDIMPESMYWLKAKESNSYKNLPPKEQTIQDDSVVKDYRRSYVEMLDKNIWGAYLDFNVINDWADLKYEDETGIIAMILMACIQVEHLVKRSREVNK